MTDQPGELPEYSPRQQKAFGLCTALPSGPAAVSECTGISVLLTNHSKKGPDLDKTTNVYEFYCRNRSFSLLSGLVSLKSSWGRRRLPPSQRERWSGLITASACTAGLAQQTAWHCFFRDKSDLLIWLWLRKNEKWWHWCVYKQIDRKHPFLLTLHIHH